MKLGRQRNYHKGWAALKHYANHPARPLWPVHLRPNFYFYRGLNSVLNVKAVVAAFNQEKAL